MKFLVDAQLPRRLADWLQGRGHDVLHTAEFARQNRTTDSEILARAHDESRVLITKDADFQLSFELGKGPPKLLLITTGNIGNDELIGIFVQSETTIITLLMQHSFIELSRTALIVHH